MSEFLTLYAISLSLTGFIGILIVEWFDKKFEGFITPLCEKVLARRVYVLEKRAKSRL